MATALTVPYSVTLNLFQGPWRKGAQPVGRRRNSDRWMLKRVQHDGGLGARGSLNADVTLNSFQGPPRSPAVASGAWMLKRGQHDGSNEHAGFA